VGVIQPVLGLWRIAMVRENPYRSLVVLAIGMALTPS